MDAIHQWVLTAPGDDFWKISIMLVLSCVAGFVCAFYFLFRKRIIEDTPTSRIRSAAQGYVELSGTGDFLENDNITAPLTGKTCTWFDYSIAKKRWSGKRSRWVVIEKGTSDHCFRLLDDTGEVVIDPEGASVTPAVTDTWYGHSRHPGRDMQKSSSLFRMGKGKYRYIEKRLHPNETLYAIGLFKTTGGSNLRFDVNRNVRELISEWKQDSDRLLAEFDQNSDGQVDLEEWEKVREEALAEVRKRHNELKTLPPINIMGKTCDKRRPYLLSAVPQSALVKRYGRYAFAGITVFITAGITGSWLILARLGG